MKWTGRPVDREDRFGNGCYLKKNYFNSLKIQFLEYGPFSGVQGRGGGGGSFGNKVTIGIRIVFGIWIITRIEIGISIIGLIFVNKT